MVLSDRPIDKAHSRQRFIADRATQITQSKNRLVQGMSATYAHEALDAERSVSRALAEAWDWLVAEGLIALDPIVLGSPHPQVLDPYFVSRWGKEVATRATKGLQLVHARRRLGVELHKRLAEPLRKLVQVGAFEEAAFKAFREVEQRVAEMANPTGKQGGRLRGEQLMNSAFSPGSGPLTDPEAEVG